MVNIIQVFNTLKTLANEDQSGFITPSSFNDLAHAAQTNVYNEIMSTSDDARKSSRSFISSESGTSSKNKSRTRQSFYIKTNKTPLDDSNSINVPSDFGSFHSLFVPTDSAAEDSGGTVVNLFYDDSIRHRSVKPYSLTTSSTSAQKESKAFLVGSKIEFMDAFATDVIFRYYRTPGSFNKGIQTPMFPAIGYSQVGATYTIDPDMSRHFDVPPTHFSEVVNEMAKLIGVQLEESMIYQYGQIEESQPEQKTID